jgi:hypothetical protein
MHSTWLSGNELPPDPLCHHLRETKQLNDQELQHLLATTRTSLDFQHHEHRQSKFMLKIAS